MRWIAEDTYRSRHRSWLLLIITVYALVSLLLGIRWLTRADSAASPYSHEDMELYGLEAAPHALIAPDKKIVIKDADSYAENDVLSFCQYTDSYYDADRLMAEADYDSEGSLFNLHLLEYDLAGNIYREQTESDTGGTQMRRYVYEYDDSGNVVHEEVYWGEKLAERNYYRYTDIGRAGISYSYVDEQFEGGLSSYCRSARKFLEDEQGNLLCAFEVPGGYPSAGWRLQWAQKDGHLVNRLLHYERHAYNDNDWYLNQEPDEEQFNLYTYNSDTGVKNCILQILYEWDYETDEFIRQPCFYMAQYEEENLLWQLSYENDRIQYYTACQYDKDGRLQAAVEYAGNDDEPYALFRRYEYPVRKENVNYYYGERLDLNDLPQVESRREAQFIYEIKGRDFAHQAEDGSNIMLTFSDEGFLAKAEMTDVSGNIRQQCEAVISGKNFGKLGKLYIGKEAAEGMEEIMERLEEEAEGYGFRVGEDLEGRLKE